MGILGIVDTVVFAAVGAATEKSVELPKKTMPTFSPAERQPKALKPLINNYFSHLVFI